MLVLSFEKKLEQYASRKSEDILSQREVGNRKISAEYSQTFTSTQQSSIALGLLPTPHFTEAIPNKPFRNNPALEEYLE